MLFVDNQNISDPRLNLAIEEYLLRHVTVTEPLLLFYVNEPSVIMGRNQNSIEEVDPDYVKTNHIHVVRRLSGGGAVFHDLGNLNFSFVTDGREDLHNFTKFTEPVIKVLRAMGVTAELHGKSDIYANGKKISGNAQYVTARRMFSHGTLLYDTSIEQMLQALNPRQIEIESKAVQSVRAFVANVRELLGTDNDTHWFRRALVKGIFGGDDIPTYPLREEDWTQIRRISADRYLQWEWNYGQTPPFNVRKSHRFPAGKIDARIDVKRGRINGVKFYGDFHSRRNVAEVESLLVGVRYDPDNLALALVETDITPYFGELSKEELVGLLY
jgi:lipoate---protein ligase